MSTSSNDFLQTINTATNSQKLPSGLHLIRSLHINKKVMMVFSNEAKSDDSEWPTSLMTYNMCVIGIFSRTSIILQKWKLILDKYSNCIMIPFWQCNIVRMSVSAKVQQDVHHFQSISFHCRKICKNKLHK